MKALEYILNDLFQNYQKNVPEVQKISKALIDRGVIKSQKEIVNDHIAFRTLGVPNLGIKSFERIFLAHGYQKKDYFDFKVKKLNAYWYWHPSNLYPRIFISELRVDELSKTAQDIIKKYTGNILEDPIKNLNLSDGKEISKFLNTPLWDLPDSEEYKSLLKESEYAAWVIYNRYYLNHYTISVHELKEGYNTIEQFNVFLKEIGIMLNDSGGEIKESPDGLLRQSSSVSKMQTASFSDHKKLEISGSYVEFAERKILPQFINLPAAEISSIHRREGFEAQNADKIFESTYSTQTQKKQ